LTAPQRPVHLNAEPLRAAAGWFGGYERFWQENLDKLEAYAKQLQKAEQKTEQQKAEPQKHRNKEKDHARSKKRH